MKIYYTTDGSVDETLQQYCPFGEEHHFKREDGSEFTIPKSVGCLGCAKCPYCYMLFVLLINFLFNSQFNDMF